MQSRWNSKKFNHLCKLLWKTFSNVCFLNANCHMATWGSCGCHFYFSLDCKYLPISSKYWLLCAETRINSGDIWPILLSLRKTIYAGPILCCLRLPPKLLQIDLQVIERTATKETCMASWMIFLHKINLIWSFDLDWLKVQMEERWHNCNTMET